MAEATGMEPLQRLTSPVVNNVLDQLKAHWGRKQLEEKKRKSTLKSNRTLKVVINGKRESPVIRLEQLLSFVYVTAKEKLEVSIPSERKGIQNS